GCYGLLSSDSWTAGFSESFRDNYGRDSRMRPSGRAVVLRRSGTVYCRPEEGLFAADRDAGLDDGVHALAGPQLGERDVHKGSGFSAGRKSEPDRGAASAPGGSGEILSGEYIRCDEPGQTSRSLEGKVGGGDGAG